MTPRLLICIACHNRKSVAELCLPTVAPTLDPSDLLALYNDGSAEYDSQWLKQFGQPGMFTPIRHNVHPLGIQIQRRIHLSDFLQTEFSHCYLSDHDVLMSPEWRSEALRLQAKYDGAPLCLYDTAAHRRLQNNTIEDDPASEVIWRRVAPGVSYLLTREHVERIAPFIPKLQYFDWEIPAILGSRFAVSRVGYVDHIGWGGCRHPENEGPEGGDKVYDPVLWLIQKRADVVAKLKAQHGC